MFALGTGFADRIDKIDFRCAIGCQIFDQKNTLTFVNVPFDAGLATETFGFFADILHRKIKGICQPRRIGDASRFTTGNRVECLVTGGIRNLTGSKFDDLAARTRE